MPKALFLYRNHDDDGDDDDDDDDDGVNYSHHPSSQNRRGVDDMSYTGSAKKKKSGNKQFNGYQTIMNSEIRQYGGQYLLQSSNHSNSSSNGGSKGGSGVKARRGNASLVVSEDLVRSNQIKRRIRWV